MTGSCYPIKLLLMHSFIVFLKQHGMFSWHSGKIAKHWNLIGKYNVLLFTLAWTEFEIWGKLLKYWYMWARCSCQIYSRQNTLIDEFSKFWESSHPISISSFTSTFRPPHPSSFFYFFNIWSVHVPRLCLTLHFLLLLQNLFLFIFSFFYPRLPSSFSINFWEWHFLLIFFIFSLCSVLYFSNIDLLRVFKLIHSVAKTY